MGPAPFGDALKISVGALNQSARVGAVRAAERKQVGDAPIRRDPEKVSDASRRAANWASLADAVKIAVRALHQWIQRQPAIRAVEGRDKAHGTVQGDFENSALTAILVCHRATRLCHTVKIPVTGLQERSRNRNAEQVCTLEKNDVFKRAVRRNAKEPAPATSARGRFDS